MACCDDLANVMITETVVDFPNPVYFTSQGATNERSHAVSAGELETLSEREVTRDISLLLSACCQE